jgi:hypothetical protein
VNVVTGARHLLASATSGIDLTELPAYDAADGRAVWNQLDPSGREVIHVFDFASNQTTTLPLPPGMAPVQPAISGNAVVFVDNSTDPDRQREDFLGRHGSLRKYDLVSNKISTLSEDPTAFQPRAAAGEVVWTALVAGGNVVASTSLNGGPVAIIGGSNPITPQTNGASIVWYDSGTLHFMEFNLALKAVVQLQVGSWPDVRSVFTLCRNALYFALPPVNDGGQSTIRVADIP